MDIIKQSEEALSNAARAIFEEVMLNDIFNLSETDEDSDPTMITLTYNKYRMLQLCMAVVNYFEPIAYGMHQLRQAGHGDRLDKALAKGSWVKVNEDD